MEIVHKNFIGRYSNVLPAGYCTHIINEFDRIRQTGVGQTRLEEGSLPHAKDDDTIFCHAKNELFLPFNLNNSINEQSNTTGSIDLFLQYVQKCYDNYANVYSILRQEETRSGTIRIQRTKPGQGYHVWHAEHSAEWSFRCLVFMLYLNTIDNDNAGETEFLYYKERIKPVENTLLFWPASFTHAHRGNVVFGEQSKYVITGWINYV